MLKNHIITALRHLLRQKSFTAINLLGLAIGVTSCILIMLYVIDETNYDTFNSNSDRIYRVGLAGRVNGNELNLATTPAPIKETLLRDFPEVESGARWRNYGFPVFRYNDKVFSEEHVIWVDPEFVQLFEIEFLAGDPATALQNPRDLVLTEESARRYFGDEDPLGKIIISDNRTDYTITGIVKDFPENSHFTFDFLASLASFPGDYESTNWLNNSMFNYVLLKEGTSAEEFERKLASLVELYVAPQVLEVTGSPIDVLLADGGAYTFIMENIEDIHLYSQLDNNPQPGGNADSVYIFSLIALGILLIAAVNFMNLSTAKSSRRAREVGIRKTIGATRGGILRQFLVESTIIAAVSVMLALIAIQLLLPMFNDLTGKALTMSYFEHWETVPAILLLVIVLGFLSGSYPALFLSSFIPVKVLKGELQQGMKPGKLRSGLVIFQFSVSIFLFISTFIILDQLNFMHSKDLGINTDQIVIIKKTDDIQEEFASFKEELKSFTGITAVTNTNFIPGYVNNSSAFKIVGEPAESAQITWNFRADFDFAKVYGIEMAKGRFFSNQFPSDSSAVIMNETAIKILGVDQPLGKQLHTFNSQHPEFDDFPIIGITKDFHFESLHSPIQPLAIFPMHGHSRYTSVKISSIDIPGTIGNIEKVWHKYAGNQVFEYDFFDKEFAAIYEAEQKTAKLFTIFSIFAIVIACLGLLGLAAFSAEQRTKEIGIRKTLGASVQQIILMVSREFSTWVLIANLIAWPAAWYLMNEWLSNFAYRIEIGIGVFVVSGLIAFVLAFITVASQTIRAATINPVDALKYE